MTTFLHTAEVRWFWRGSLPPEMVAWLLDGDDPGPNRRTDRYLVFPGCETIGVKRRDGNFEIKARRGGAEVVQFPDGGAGRADRWVKWASADAPNLGTTGWINVGKARRQRQWVPDGDGWREIDPDATPPAGCSVEVTAVRVNGGDWWTFGFEAVGPPEEGPLLLHRAARWLFARGTPPVPLDASRSCAYPTWLATFA